VADGSNDDASVFGRRTLLNGAAGLALSLCTPAVLGQDGRAGRSAGSGGLPAPDAARIGSMLDRAPELGPIHAILAAREGEIVAERHYAGPGLSTPANIKSISKTVLSALVGIAVERGIIAGPDQPIVELLDDRVPPAADPAIRRVTVDHLLSMRAGLQSTSGSNYGRWIVSSDWVAHALSRPFVAEPGAALQYSTGTWHLLSAILTRQTGRSTLELARNWLGEPLNITIPPWPRDPQGIFFGGNDMLLSPRALLRFGEMYRNGGAIDGRRVVSRDWIEASWQPRAVSPYSNHPYGYGWFVTELGGRTVHYGRGYGGQLLYVVPEQGLTVVITSDPMPPSAGGRYVRALHRLVETGLVAGGTSVG
jgi:CubicO group peptidase (beta-lactamase class C family)